MSTEGVEALAVRAQTPERARRRRRARPLHRSLLLHATLLVAVFISLFPPAVILLTSFKPRAEVLSAKFQLFVDPSLDNYRYILGDGLFVHWAVNSLVVALATTVVGLFLSSTAAYAFSRFRFPAYRPLLQTFLVMQMFPGIILIVPLFNILSSLKLVNTQLGLIIAYCTLAVPFCVYMLKSYFDTIPIEIEEAARVDGLSPFGAFWRIVLPLSLPGLAVTAFYCFLTAWNEFLIANILMTTDTRQTLPVGIARYVGQFQAEWHLLTAASVIILLPTLAVFFFAQRFLISGLTAGGTKG
jgi:arabinogalactan oligomer/maltooligosaccharide transport system permease protein